MDLYAILGVPRTATQSEIKAAYRELARSRHPDVSASPDANAEFAQINEAYRILGNARRRGAYDLGFYHSPAVGYDFVQAAQAVAIQKKFDRIVDEMIARDRQEVAARSHAVLVVVPLFLSAFYVMLAKPRLIGQLSMAGLVLTVLLCFWGVVYLIRNLSVALARYTYEMPSPVISVFRHSDPPDKPVSRRAGLVFLVCGYIVSVGLGYIVSEFVPLLTNSSLTASAVAGLFVYPPIAVLIIGGLRKMIDIMDRT